MPVEALLGAAWAYSSSAFQYNMGRYQFDSNQKQNTSHQTQNIKINLWSLFREDVRDLFGITTSNLSTYMLIGTLFLGLTTNMIWNVLNDFPPEPPFLILFYCNSLYASTAYGVLSVWLAMHGTIAAHSASVKVLTQAVRPPIPTAQEIEKVAYDQSKYESTPSKMMEVPNLLGWRDDGNKNTTGNTTRQPDGAATREESGVHRSNSEQRGVMEDDPNREEPGPSALMVSAHELLIVFAYYIMAHLYTRENERTSFSRHPSPASWTGVIFLAFTGMILFKLDLFVERQSMRVAKMVLLGAPLFSILSVALWAKNQAQRRQGLPDLFDDMAPQFVALFAAVLHLLLEGLLLWEARPHGEAKLPTCFRSVQYTDLFGWWYESANAEARGGESFCSSSSIGSTPRSPGDKKSADGIPEHTSVEVVQAARQMRRLSRKVSGTLACENLSDHLTTEDVNRLNNLSSTLEMQSENLRLSMLSTSSSNRSSFAGNDNDVWLQCRYNADSGHDVPYFVNSNSGEVRWESPTAGEVINVDTMSNTANELCERASRVTPSRAEKESPARPSQQVRFEPEVELQALTRENDVNIRVSTLSMEPGQLTRANSSTRLSANFEPLRRRPNSKHESSSMAWKYFQQVTVGVVILWVVTFLWILFYGIHTIDYITGVTVHNKTYNQNTHRAEAAFLLARDKSSSVVSESFHPYRFLLSSDSSANMSMRVEQVTVDWPHQAFRPAALACREADILIGERFAVYTTSLQSLLTETQTDHRLTPALVAPDIPVPWSAVGAVSSGERVFLLESGGASVYERDGRSNLSWRQWKLGRSAGFHLRTITVVEGDMAKGVCKFLGINSPDWALYGSTTSGEIVSLCPYENLEPVHVLAQLEAVEIIGISCDYDGNVWVLSQSHDIAQLHRFALDGSFGGLWQLPTARHWATGICALRGRDLLALSVAPGPHMTKIPELWHFTLEESRVAVSA